MSRPTRRRIAVLAAAGLALADVWALYRRLVGRPFREAHPESHQALLADGPMPLPLLKRRVEVWISRRSPPG